MVNTGPGACPVCGQKATLYAVPRHDGFRVECPRCGNFIVPGLLLRTVLKGSDSDSETKELLPFLSAYIRQANERDEHIILDDNWPDFALAHKKTPVSRKATKLLEVIAAQSTYGHPTKLDHLNDLSLVDAKDLAEFAFLLKHLTDHEFISRTNIWTYALKVKGWEYLQSPTAGDQSPAIFNFYSSVGAVQTGPSATANVVQTINPSDKETLLKALETVKQGLVDIDALPSHPKKEIIELVDEAHIEVDKSNPNRTRLGSILQGIATAIQTAGSLQPAYQALKAALIPFGIPLP